MRDTYDLLMDWVIRSFGEEHAFSIPVLSLRLAEETVELAQALGIPREKMVDLVNIVYSRPEGTPHREMSQVLLVAFATCMAMRRDPDEMFLDELRRVLAKPPSEFARRNQEKLDLGLKA